MPVSKPTLCCSKTLWPKVIASIATAIAFASLATQSLAQQQTNPRAPAHYFDSMYNGTSSSIAHTFGDQSKQQSASSRRILSKENVVKNNTPRPLNLTSPGNALPTTPRVAAKVNLGTTTQKASQNPVNTNYTPTITTPPNQPVGPSSRRSFNNMANSRTAVRPKPTPSTPRVAATPKIIIPPTRVNSKTSPVDSKLGKIEFMKAKQFLSQTPTFEDPQKYLAKPKVRKTKPRKTPPIFTRQQLASQSKSGSSTRPGTPPSTRPRSTQERESKRPQLNNEPLMNEIADVRSPISAIPFGKIRQSDQRLLVQEDSFGAPMVSGDQVNYSQLTQSEFIPSSKAWLAPNFVHRPLYFEETQLERYGNRRPLQVISSGLHFFGTIPRLPYKMGADRPSECQYTYGHYRPGDCVAHEVYRRPLDKAGLLSQAFWTSAIAIPH